MSQSPLLQPAPRGPSTAAILDRLERFGVRLGLERMRCLLGALGHPEERLPTVLVAGTNGKGSTAAQLASMLGAAGYRAGLYTSPHLEDPTERLRLDGRSIDDLALGALLAEVVAVSESACGTPPTYFEALTAAALLYYEREGAELAVLEVGLGGRLDATNTADPVLSLITGVALDHQEHLGSTVEKIAREKAGILRAGKPALAWWRSRRVGQALEAAASEIGAALASAAEQVRFESGVTVDEETLLLTTPGGTYRLKRSLAGRHQEENLALAVLAAERLAELGWRRIDSAAILTGAAACRWPGRLEEVKLETGLRVLLDGAHNAEAAAAVARHLKRRAESYDLLYGTLKGKRAEVILPALARRAERVYLTTPPGDRGRPAQELRGLIETGRLKVEPDWRAALEQGLAGLEERTLLVCGSLYLVGAVRAELRQRFGSPEAAARVITGATAETSQRINSRRPPPPRSSSC